MRKIFTSFPKHTSHPDNCGIVITGFGEADVFPKFIEYEIQGKIKNRLKCREIEKLSISYSNKACIRPFAQASEIDSFITGIHPKLSRKAGEDTSNILKEFTNFINEIIEDNDKYKSVHDTINEIREKILTKYEEEFKEYVISEHVIPVYEIISVLPKDELAIMAETLVNLEKFKKRITIESETVGGPIDVAVISKGDGFIWIKRKHYFNKDLNPYFFLNMGRKNK